MKRRPFRVHSTETGFTAQEFEPKQVKAECRECGTRREVDGFTLFEPRCLAYSWVMIRRRAKGHGALLAADHLIRKDQEMVVFLQLIADQHRFETGHDTWTTWDYSFQKGWLI